MRGILALTVSLGSLTLLTCRPRPTEQQVGPSAPVPATPSVQGPGAATQPAAGAAAAPRPAEATPSPAAKQSPPLLQMLGRDGTEVGRAFASCRLHQPSPVVMACEGRVDGHGALGLFTYDMAQVVQRVQVIFPAQATLEPALQQARALMQGLTTKAKGPLPKGGGPRRWSVSSPKLRGEVHVGGKEGAWVTEGDFVDPTFRPAKL